jgi:hypothetical protein
VTEIPKTGLFRLSLYHFAVRLADTMIKYEKARVFVLRAFCFGIADVRIGTSPAFRNNPVLSPRPMKASRHTQDCCNTH